jgi:uncharacterized protein (TIRG00374 family)
MVGEDTGRGPEKRISRGFLINAVSLLLLVLVVFIAVGFVRRNWDIFVDLVELSPAYIVSMSGLILAFQLLSGAKVKILTSIFDLDLKAREWFGLAQANSLLNYLPVRGGSALSAFYLKGFHGFPITGYLAVLTASFAVTTAVFSTAGFLAAVIVSLTRGVFPLYTLAVYVFLIASIFTLFVFVSLAAKRVKNHRLLRFLSGWEKIREGGRRLAALIALDFVMISMDAMRIKLSYGRFGVDLDYFMGLAMVPVSNLASVVSLIPGGLVAREFVMGLISGELGMGFDVGVFASALDRVILFFWILLLGSISLVVLRQYRSKTRANT